MKRFLLASLLVTLSSSTAFAYKTGTHVAAANNVSDQLAGVITTDPVSQEITFNVKGRRLDLLVTAKDAYLALQAYPEFYRAGVIGPDGFPDVLTGQMMMHGDQTDFIKDVVEQVRGTRPGDMDSFQFWEDRPGVSQYRSIDFATAMLEFFHNRYTPASAVERAQITAFIIGYISHGVGDGFAHTWVNEIAGGAWDLFAGGGMWGVSSEEVKHVAVETLVDELVPDALLSVPGDQGGQMRIAIRAPDRFLDAFYSSVLTHAGTPFGDKDGDLDGFLRYYADIDKFHGGFFYNYLNSQTHVASSLKNWSGLNPFFNLAEDIKNNWFVNFGLDVADIPAEILQHLNPLTWVDELTFGWVDCHVDANGPTVIDDIRFALDFVGGVNERADEHGLKAEIIRRNWILLSECTSQNMAKTQAAEFDLAQPTFNTDACADIVRAGWQDENTDGRGLYRGTGGDIIQPGSDQDQEFLVDLKAAFLGGDADEVFAHIDNPWETGAPWNADEVLETGNGHRSLRDNIARQFDFISDMAFRMDEIAEVIMPETHDGDTSVRDRYEELCATVRDPAFENCLDIAFAPLALIGRQVACEADLAECVAEQATACAENLCGSACAALPVPSFLCNDVCDGHTSDCEKFCDGFCPIPVLACEPLTFFSCNTICDAIDGDADTCQAAVVQVGAECGPEHFLCTAENIVDTIRLENYAEELLTPARDACDVVDEVLALVECFRGDPALTPDERAAARRTCFIDTCAARAPGMTHAQCVDMYNQADAVYQQAENIKEQLGLVADALRDRPAHELVNLAFLEEDLREDPAYLADLAQTSADTRAELLANPPPSGATPEEIAEYNRKLNTLDRLDQLIIDVQNHAATGNFVDLQNDAAEAGSIIRTAAELGLIPTAIGPTARRIYNDVGPDFRNSFLPFFNTTQGMKLVPLTSQGDIEGMFSEVSLSTETDMLPWNTPGHYSPVCSGVGTNLYCDVIRSFDDPSCMNCDASLLNPSAAHNNWVPGKTVVAWTESATGQLGNDVTRFPVSNADRTYDELYTRIFFVPGEEWNQFRGGLQRRGQSYFLGPMNGNTVESFNTWGDVRSSPVIGPDGTIYVGSSDGRVYALNADMTQKWSFMTWQPVTASPAIYQGYVYVGSRDNRLHKLDAQTGAELDYFDTFSDINTSILVGPDGTLYFGVDNGDFYALDSDLNVIWEYDTGFLAAPIRSSAALAPDGSALYFGTNSGRLVALSTALNRTQANRMLWQANLGGFLMVDDLIGTPAVGYGPDYKVHIGTTGGTLFALNPSDGSVAWQYRPTGLFPPSIRSSVAVAPDGTVYYGASNGRLYAVSNTGGGLWSYPTWGFIDSSPLIGADGIIYFGSDDNWLYAIRPGVGLSDAARLVFRVDTWGDVNSSPAISADRALYVGSDSNRLYKIGPTR